MCGYFYSQEAILAQYMFNGDPHVIRSFPWKPHCKLIKETPLSKYNLDYVSPSFVSRTFFPCQMNTFYKFTPSLVTIT
jgi:hypothetical protein